MGRSLLGVRDCVATAIIVGGEALAQVWLFLIAPVVGGVLAGVVDRLTERPVHKAV